jgi:hypothetical protein
MMTDIMDAKLTEDTYVDLMMIVTDDGGTLQYYQSCTGAPWLAKKGQTMTDIYREMAAHESTLQYYQQEPEKWEYDKKRDLMLFWDNEGYHEVECILMHFGYEKPLWQILEKQRKAQK